MTKKIQDCLRIEDDGKAMTCLLKELGDQKGESCPAQFVFLHAEDCEPCDEEEIRYAEGIKKGLIRKVSVESPEGLRIIRANGIDWAPALVVLDCHNMVIEP